MVVGETGNLALGGTLLSAIEALSITRRESSDEVGQRSRALQATSAERALI
jgi:hypothetical protein